MKKGPWPQWVRASLDALIIGMIEEHDAGMPTAEMCYRHGVRQGTFYRYKSKFGGMEVSDVARMRSLEDETAKLKRLMADTMLERGHVRHWPERQWRHISQCLACRLVGVDPKTVRRDRPSDTPEILQEMKAVAAKRRRIGVMLAPQGMIMNHS